jgi:hypothetical protein
VNMKRNTVVFILSASLSIALFSITGCMKQYSFESYIYNQPATGSLKDNSGNCLPITPYGTFYNGIATGDTNYIQINVNVTKPGTYNIQTDLQNGFQFSGAGIFTDSGLYTITLKASGTPLKDTVTNFTLTFDSTSCMFSVNVNDSTDRDGGLLTLNSWRFNGNGKMFRGPVVTAQFAAVVGGQLSIAGTMQSGSTDTIFAVTVQFPGNSITTGAFVTSDVGTNFAFEKVPSTDIIFAANAVQAPPIVTITIVSYDASTNVVTGSFTGNATDSSGKTVPIINGGFIAQVQ